MSPAEELIARLRATDAEAIVLIGHRAAVADALASDGRRVLRIGGPGVCETAPSIAINHGTLVREAFRRAFAAGHRRVCMPLRFRKPEMIPVIRGWIAATYAEAGLSHSPAFDAPVIESASPDAMRDCIRGLCRHTPPGCFVMSDHRHWLVVFTLLASLRLRVPEDVSTILLDASQDMNRSFPSQAHFRHPLEAFLPEIRRILRRRDRGVGLPAVPVDPKWVPGVSLGPPVRRVGASVDGAQSE